MNDVVNILKTLVECAFVLFSYRLGKGWLMLTVPVNMILIAVLGAKVVVVFGFVTNAGNIFYAGVFLAMQMLVERYGRQEGLRTMWAGLAASAFFVVMAELTARQAAASLGGAGATDTLLQLVPRVAFASGVAFLASQLINVTLYDRLHAAHGRRLLWLRSNLANVLGQAVDSAIFFSIAFIGILPTDVLLQTMFVGYLAKVVMGAVGTVFIYATRFDPAKLA